MARKLILHAGMPKTGTTSIQNACHAVRERLLEQDGLLYPSVAPNHTNAICTLFMNDPRGHIANKMANRNSEDEIAAVQAKFRDSLVADLERDGWDTVLVSAEGVVNLSLEELCNIRDFFVGYVDEFDVIYYVREPIAYAVSVMQQLLKSGSTLAQLYDNPELPNFRGRIGNAIGAFGAGSIRVRDFGAAVQAAGGLVNDFCQQTGMSAEATAVVLEASRIDNESLSFEAARMLSLLNSIRPLFVENRRSELRTGKETLSLETIRGNKFQPPAAVRRAIWKNTRSDVEWLNTMFGNDFFDTPEPSEEEIPLDHEKQATAARETIVLVSDLLNRIEALEASLKASELKRSGHVRAAKHQADYALRIAPDHPLIQAVAKEYGA